MDQINCVVLHTNCRIVTSNCRTIVQGSQRKQKRCSMVAELLPSSSLVVRRRHRRGSANSQRKLAGRIGVAFSVEIVIRLHSKRSEKADRSHLKRASSSKIVVEILVIYILGCTMNAQSLQKHLHQNRISQI